jgi:hypothetical protein
MALPHFPFDLLRGLCECVIRSAGIPGGGGGVGMIQAVGDAGDGRFFEAAQTLAQSLSQWALLIIGGSLVVIVSTSYYRPKTRRARAVYFLFLPSWLLLALCVYKGSYIQQSYVAYLVASRVHAQDRIDLIAQHMATAIEWQLHFLHVALGMLGVWLVFYIVWWVVWND